MLALPVLVRIFCSIICQIVCIAVKWFKDALNGLLEDVSIGVSSHGLHKVLISILNRCVESIC